MSDNIEPHESMSDFDKLTLQMFCNKNQYNKYLAKTDPKQYSENQVHLDNISRNSYKILDMFSVLLDNPEKQITTSINESFDHFIKACLNHFENEKLAHTSENSTKEDVLFAEMNDSDDEGENITKPKTSSYWGKSVIKKTTPITQFNSLDGFVTKKRTHK
jgi:hypothetical protein